MRGPRFREVKRLFQAHKLKSDRAMTWALVWLQSSYFKTLFTNLPNAQGEIYGSLDVTHLLGVEAEDEIDIMLFKKGLTEVQIRALLGLFFLGT